MPAFNRRATTRVITHPSWDEGESVTVRPRVTGAMFSRAQEAANPIPNDVRAKLLSMDETERLRVAGEYKGDPSAFSRAILEEYIVSWTLRDTPTEEQEAAGQPGDIVPVTSEAIADLPVHYLQPLEADFEAHGLGDFVLAQSVTNEGTPQGATFHAPAKAAGARSAAKADGAPGA